MRPVFFGRRASEKAVTQEESRSTGIGNRGPASTHEGDVEVENVWKHFRRPDGHDLTALRDVSLSIRRGEFIGLVGPSGCGKSTLLRIIGGLIRPTSGRVLIEGKVVDGPRRKTGIMFQEPTLFPWRSVIANILLPIEITKRTPAGKDEHQAHKLLNLAGLEGFAHHYPRELSGGMQQRVALMRVLMTEPSLMLLDEPFGALDEFTRERLNVELSRIIAERSVATILVTHSISEAVFLADRVIAMGTAPGRLLGQVEIALTRPRSLDVLRSPEFQEMCSTVREVLGT